jgi:hypothetical protein
LQQLLFNRILSAAFTLLLLGMTAGYSAPAFAQDFTVEVVVADPGARQRTSAYWLALNRVMQRNMPPGTLDDSQRSEVLKDPARYVQTFRYRPYNAATDANRLSTRQVREGAPADSVIVVTFPATLPGNLQRQFQSQVLQEEVVTPGSGRILALIAVEQDGEQFLIGGDTARKFQSRMSQVGSANNLTFEFPQLDDEDLSIISPANVLFNDQAVLDAMTQKYSASGRIAGALTRIGEASWQSDWRYQFAGGQAGDLSLTTRSLDEALLTAVTEISSGGASAGSGFFAGDVNFERPGVLIRVENINSLESHQRVLQLLRSIDSSAVAEKLEPGATIYRALNADQFGLQQQLAGQPALTSLPELSGESFIAYRLR